MRLLSFHADGFGILAQTGAEGLGPGINIFLGDNEAAPLFDGRSPLTMAEALDLRVCRTTLCDGDVHLQMRPAIPQE
mgnify:CR=1 FL=1